MSKKLYAKPALQMMVCEGHVIMGGSGGGGKYDFSVDEKTQVKGPAKEENPDEIDAKAYRPSSGIWDD